jgi:putative ABC transport system permease protein
MLHNYFKIIYRNLLKHKVFSFINIFGLAIGLACFALIGAYIRDELSYDRYHPDFERIHRVVEIIKDTEESSSCPFSVGPTLLNDFPEQIERAVRFFNFQAPSLTLERTPESRFREQNLFFVDSTVFDVFAYSFKTGDPATALQQPNSIVLTESLARKYFGEEDPMGKTLKYEGNQVLQVTAVLEDIPRNSHLLFEGLISYSTLRSIFNGEPQGWVWNPNWTYIKLREGVKPADLEARFPDFVQSHFPAFIKPDVSLYLQPLKDIHLRSHLDFEIRPNSDISYVYIFLAVAFFIILIAAINYVNLSTARSGQRAREVGMRKTLGARKGQLVAQFLGESVAVSILAGAGALVIIQLLLPLFNPLAGKAFSLSSMVGDPLIAGGFVAIVLLLGLLGGLYPAFFLSSFNSVEVLKNSYVSGKQGTMLRKLLVAGQFTVSIILVAATLVSYRQLQFLQTRNLGFDKEQVMVISAQASPVAAKYESFRNALLQSPQVLSVTGMELPIGAEYQNHEFRPEGVDEEEWIYYPSIFVLPGFEEAFGLEIVAGRAFSENNQRDLTEAVIINETLVRQLDWGTPDEAVGKKFDTPGGPARVIGVMKDFNAASLHKPVMPFVIDLPNNTNQLNFFIRYFAIRFAGEKLPEVVSFVEKTWAEFDPDRPMEFFFLDDRLDQLYAFESKINKAAGAFAVLAILIACLGLFGLATFTAERRAKEIGIRKVLGASTSHVLLLLSKEYTRLVLLSFLAATPLAYYLLRLWLERFAYQTAIGPGVFIVAGGVTLLICWFTISFQSLKAAWANPVEAIKND